MAVANWSTRPQRRPLLETAMTDEQAEYIEELWDRIPPRLEGALMLELVETFGDEVLTILENYAREP